MNSMPPDLSTRTGKVGKECTQRVGAARSNRRGCNFIDQVIVIRNISSSDSPCVDDPCNVQGLRIAIERLGDEVCREDLVCAAVGEGHGDARFTNGICPPRLTRVEGEKGTSSFQGASDASGLSVKLNYSIPGVAKNIIWEWPLDVHDRRDNRTRSSRDLVSPGNENSWESVSGCTCSGR